MKRQTFDIETYWNYSLFAIEDIDTGKLHTFELRGRNASLNDKQKSKLAQLLDKNLTITFNGIKFDEPLTAYALKGKTASEIKAGANAIIVDKLPRFAFYKKGHCRPFITNQIDIMDVARGTASLKLYGARLGTKKLQDLPYEPEKELTESEMDEILLYCGNDLVLTSELHNFLKDDLALRADITEQYGIDVMSDKGAKIAEKLLVKETGYDGKAMSIPNHIYYTPPKYVKFKTPQMKEFFKYIKEHKYLLSDSGNVELPAKLRMEKVLIDGVEYKMGNGGIHGSVESTTIIPKKGQLIVDIDYKSLYPSLLIENGYYPKSIGKPFLKTYQGMYDRRNKELKPAMKNVEYGSKEYIALDNAQNTMKLVLNSSFGLLGLRYSKLYDPEALLHITLTGQLTLMMVVEKLHLKGFKTFYANTDGITLLIDEKDLGKVQKITRKFDKKTGLEMEYNFFKASHIRDVNNFVNITDDNKVKSKGAYGEMSIEKNSQTPIVFKAVRDYLLHRATTPEKDQVHATSHVHKTIKACKDVNAFCSSRTVKGGAMYGKDLEYEQISMPQDYAHLELPELRKLREVPLPENWEVSLKRNKRITKAIMKLVDSNEANFVKDNGTYLGKVVRWYYAKDGSSIHYKSNGNKVPMTNSTKPLMDLPKNGKMPKDLDYEWYYNYANRMLEDLGYVEK